eukprot:scaffold39123_cov42-Phaeocystis_antarctica.AAC.1
MGTHGSTPGVDHRKFAALVIDLSFTRGGRELYACTLIAGYLGVLTGVRAGDPHPNPNPNPNPNPYPYPNPNPNPNTNLNPNPNPKPDH